MRLAPPAEMWTVGALAAALCCGAGEARQSDVSPRTYLIVCTEALRPIADEWASYRQSEQGGGWRTLVHSVAAADASQQRNSIREAIRKVYRSSAIPDPGDFTVLLLGDADSTEQAGIPAWYFPQLDSVMRSGDGANDQFATDHPYQLMDDRDDGPDVALGRIPARHPEEARLALEKIKHYEKTPSLEMLAAGQRTRISYTASEGRFGVFDDMLEELFKSMVDRMVPDAFELSMIYAKPSSIYCPPPSRLNDAVMAQLNAGGLLFNYIGHGYERGFDSLHWRDQRFPIMTVADLQRGAEKERPSTDVTDGADKKRHRSNCLPIAFLSCCSAGWYDLPGGDESLAEAMFFNPAGSIAVIAGSRITHPYANAVMQMNVTKSLLVDRTPTIGLLDLSATRAMLRRGPIDRQLDAIAAPIARSGKWETSLANLRRMHVKLYNLIGDPATRVALPARSVQNLMVTDHFIAGEITGMKSGRVTITAETARTSMANPEKLQPPTGNADENLESKAAENFRVVNDRIVAQYAAEVDDGRFRVELKRSVPSAAAAVRAYAVGIDAMNHVFDACGAVRIEPK